MLASIEGPRHGLETGRKKGFGFATGRTSDIPTPQDGTATSFSLFMAKTCHKFWMFLDPILRDKAIISTAWFRFPNFLAGEITWNHEDTFPQSWFINVGLAYSLKIPPQNTTIALYPNRAPRDISQTFFRSPLKRHVKLLNKLSV